MSYSETWQAARERRRARRAADPKVQARAIEHANRANREAAAQEAKLQRGAA